MTTCRIKECGKTNSIHLAKSNMVQGLLPNKGKVIALVDSGATKTLISMSTITNSSYLSSIARKSVENSNFEIANAEEITIKEAITFQVNIQEHVFEMTGLVVPSLGSLDILWGIKCLKEINASLDFSTNTLKFNCKSSQDVTLKPHQSKEIELMGKLPNLLRNGDVVIKGNKLLNTIAPNVMLTRLLKDRIKIMVENNSNKVVKITKSKPIASLDLNLSQQLITPITHIERTDNDTIMFANKADIKAEYISNYSNQSTIPMTNIAYRSTGNCKSDGDTLYDQKREKYPFLEATDQ